MTLYMLEKSILGKVSRVLSVMSPRSSPDLKLAL
jgi:hypothetical protein